jgi:prepilin-type N-terminal cleavage/methylation domain-containing protein
VSQRPVSARRCADDGFVLLEAIVAVAIIAICAGAALAALSAFAHDAGRALPAASLTVSAQNVLTDLRAATAYDPAELAGLAGRSTTFTATEPGPSGSPLPVAITVDVVPATSPGSDVGVVTARAPSGAAVTVSATLAAEAPAPGSVVPASTPPPNADAPGAATDSPDTITL